MTRIIDLDRLRIHWEKPLSVLAKKFGVSGVAVLRMGQRHGFPPRRPRGRPKHCMNNEKPFDRVKVEKMERAIREKEGGACKYRCYECLAIFQGESCPNGHQRVRSA